MGSLLYGVSKKHYYDFLFSSGLLWENPLLKKKNNFSYGHLKSCFPADDCATPLGAAGAQLFATFGAGAATTVLTNPLSVLRTRIVMSPVTLSPVSALRGVLRDGGVRALFTRGLGPSLCGVSHGAAQIIFYERIKTEVLRRRGRKTGKMVSVVFFVC